MILVHSTFMPGKLKLLRLHPQKNVQIMEANNINNILYIYIKHSRHNKYYTNKQKKIKVNTINLFGLGIFFWNKVIISH